MKQNSFVALTVLTVAAATVAVINREATIGPEPGIGGPLLPNLAAQINQVTALVVTSESRSATISRPNPDSTVWTVAERDGYPASLDQVRRAVLGLAEAKLMEPRTANPEQYARIGVDDASGTRMTISAGELSKLPPLLIGKAGPGGSFYARRVGETQTWLVTGKLSPPLPDPLQWIDRSLPTVARNRVMSATISHPGSHSGSLTISRKDPGQKDFAITGLAEGAKPEQARVNELAGAAEFLSFEDVIKAETAAKPDPDAISTRFRSFDGDILTFHLSRSEGKTWATVSAGFDAGQAAKGGAKPAEVEQRIQDIQSRHAGWSYRLSDFAAKELSRSADELTEKEAKAEVPSPEKK